MSSKSYSEHDLAHSNGVTPILPGQVPTAIESLEGPSQVPAPTLQALPQELIVHIASYLSPIEAAVFKLSCQTVYHELDQKIFDKLNVDLHEPGNSCHEFLQLLVFDLPDHILCFYCHKLHAIKDAASLDEHWKLRVGGLEPGPPCSSPHRLVGGITRFPEFSSVTFQMLMKQHLQGRDCTELLEMLPPPNRISFYEHWETKVKHRKQLSGLARIVDGTLLYRAQIVFSEEGSGKLTTRVPVRVCVHRTVKYDNDGAYLEEWPEKWPRNSSDYLVELGTGLHQCTYCYTEYSVQLLQENDTEVTLYVTIWKDFGEGEVVDTLKWRGHTRNHYYRVAYNMERVDFHPGSICSMFEGKNPELVDVEEIGRATSGSETT